MTVKSSTSVTEPRQCGGWVARDTRRGLAAHGNTAEEAIANLNAVIELLEQLAARRRASDFVKQGQAECPPPPFVPHHPRALDSSRNSLRERRVAAHACGSMLT